MKVIFSIVIKGVRHRYEIRLGMVVLTYDGRLSQVIDINDYGILLSSGEWAEAYELVPVRWLGYRAHEVMRRRGKSRI